MSELKNFIVIVLEFTAIVQGNPCVPNPCGPNSQCRELNGQVECLCLPTYVGSPPSCRPECVVNSECDLRKACVNQKCVDPCPGACGENAVCRVNNHSPLCSCPSGFTGSPFSRCYPTPSKNFLAYHCLQYKRLFTLEPLDDTPEPSNPCAPSPCGPHSQCRPNQNLPSCTCLSNYFGAPPNCRPECSVNSDCPNSKACINERCRDPCVGVCGIATKCHVINHTPICTCLDGLIGDPFSRCYEAPAPPSNKIEFRTRD